jgi:hypothetical protein
MKCLTNFDFSYIFRLFRYLPNFCISMSWKSVEMSSVVERTTTSIWFHKISRGKICQSSFCIIHENTHDMNWSLINFDRFFQHIATMLTFIIWGSSWILFKFISSVDFFVFPRNSESFLQEWPVFSVPFICLWLKLWGFIFDGFLKQNWKFQAF